MNDFMLFLLSPPIIYSIGLLALIVFVCAINLIPLRAAILISVCLLIVPVFFSLLTFMEYRDLANATKALSHH
jgi:hypothetical protein